MTEENRGGQKAVFEWVFVNIFRFREPVAFWRYRGWPDPLPPSAWSLVDVTG